MWAARHDLYYAGLALKPGCQSLTTDVCVPISNLATCIHQTHAALEASALTGLILGHVGDGNFHTLLLFDADNASEAEEAQRLNAEIVAQALALDGTCTGEHGIGLAKAPYMQLEHDPVALQLMTSLKGLLDPNKILNPGKMSL